MKCISLIMVLSLSASAQQPAASADRFVDSIGINTHFSWLGSVYTKYLTTPAPNGYTTPSLIEALGVRHIRESIAATTYGECTQMQQLGAAGVSWEFYSNQYVAGADNDPTTAPADLGEAYACLGNPSYLLAFEGPNEIDTLPCSDQYCTTEVLQQAAMMKTARTAGVFPATTDIWPASAPNGQCEADTAWGTANGGQLSTDIDFTINHGYFGDDQPDIAATGGHVCNIVPLYGSWQYFIAAADSMAPSSNYPVATTETGYTDPSTSGSLDPVDATTKTKYEMRDVLGYFANGSYYTFLYDLANDASGSYGLTDGSLNPKPAFYGIQALIQALVDPGVPFSPAPLTITENLPSDVSSLLLGKRDGSYWLVLWQNDASWNTSTNKPISVPSTTAKLTLSSVPSAVTHYIIAPSTGKMTTQAITRSKTITVPVTDTPSIIELKE
jgi:hypothetical protein